MNNPPGKKEAFEQPTQSKEAFNEQDPLSQKPLL